MIIFMIFASAKFKFTVFKELTGCWDKGRQMYKIQNESR